MTEVKGVGKTIALTILAYLPDLDSLSRVQKVSLSGLAPLAAQSAARHNDVIKSYVSRLVDAGQPYKSVLVAAMRKILICLRSLIMKSKFWLA
jgi:hypothetical protein